MENNYDAIIIGSGVGGLTCGTFLAKKGMKVLVLEQHFMPGGYAVSYKREGSVFDTIFVCCGLKKGAMLYEIFSYINLDKKVDFIELEDMFRTIGPDITVNWSSDINKSQLEFIEKFPHEEEGIKKYFRTIQKIWDEVIASYYNPNIIQKLKYPICYPNLVKYINKTYKQFLDMFFKDAKLKEYLSSVIDTIGSPPSKASAIYYICMFMGFYDGSVWYPKGGYQVVSDGLVDCLKENGGDIKFRKKVSRIIINKRKAIGVELEGGAKFYGKYIISNADTKSTYLDLIGEEYLSKKFFKKINNLEQSLSGIAVNLIVKMDKIPDVLRDCGWVAYFSDYGVIEKNYKSALKGELGIDSGRYAFDVSCNSLKDENLSAKGFHNIKIVTYPASIHYKNNWNYDNREEYNKLKNNIAEKLIKKTEKIIPNLGNSIVFKDISTPITYKRYTSANDGGWYDLAITPKQSILNREGNKTPFKGLFFTGSKSMIGPGFYPAICSGVFTADKILKGKLTKGKILFEAGDRR